MPTLIIQTNAVVPAERRKVVLEAASSLVAEQLGKPESYVMVLMQHNEDMLFGADDAPMAYLELKSLDLPEDRTPELSAALCAFMEQHFGVSPARVYIELASPPRHLFGWNGGTF
jgi:phenylpyruvate tautomerase PptA (4-oxalocrotonate tautomerase family)